MAYRGTVHRGTPYHHVTDTKHQGIMPGRPGGFEKTSRAAEGHKGADYTSDTRGYQRSGESGTPYHTEAGNGPEYKRTVTHSTNAESSDHGNQNDPRTNGKGVILDGANNQESGYLPRSERTLDSPVPEHAPVFNTHTMQEENRAHAGMRNEHTATDDILSIGGVLSRGMVGTSSRHGPEDELMQDDEFSRDGHATQSQPKGSVKHIKE